MRLKPRMVSGGWVQCLILCFQWNQIHSTTTMTVSTGQATSTHLTAHKVSSNYKNSRGSSRGSRRDTCFYIIILRENREIILFILILLSYLISLSYIFLLSLSTNMPRRCSVFVNSKQNYIIFKKNKKIGMNGKSDSDVTLFF